VNKIHDALQHALQSGDRGTARRLLAAALRADPQNVQAWLSMIEVVDTDEQRRECLQRVLAIEPDNQAARAGLVQLEKQASRGRSRQSEVLTVGPRRGAGMPLPQQRYLRLAGGLSLTLLLGLALLVLALIQIGPQHGNRPSERALHTATLWCPSCAREGQPVIFSTRIGARFHPSAQAGGLPHGTRVAVLRYRWSALERRYYALVAAEGKRGWVPETQIRK
jgi:hypothetical protein